VFDNGCSISRKSDEGFDSASENLSPAQSVDLHAAFSLQPQLKLIEALVHRCVGIVHSCGVFLTHVYCVWSWAN